VGWEKYSIVVVTFKFFGICAVEEERKEIIGCEEVYVVYLI
jgi:hypothetical protein